MACELLECGMPTVLAQNVSYALPVRKTTLFCGNSSPTIQQSNVYDFASSSAVTLVNGQADLSGGFLRATTANALVILAQA